MAHKLSLCRISVGMQFTNISLDFTFATNNQDQSKDPHQREQLCVPLYQLSLSFISHI